MSYFEFFGTDYCSRRIKELQKKASKLEMKGDTATIKGASVTVHYIDTTSQMRDSITITGEATAKFKQTGWDLHAYLVEVELCSGTHKLTFSDNSAFKIVENEASRSFGGFMLPSTLTITDGGEKAEASYCMHVEKFDGEARGVYVDGHVSGCRIEPITTNKDESPNNKSACKICGWVHDSKLTRFEDPTDNKNVHTLTDGFVRHNLIKYLHDGMKDSMADVSLAEFMEVKQQTPKDILGDKLMKFLYQSTCKGRAKIRPPGVKTKVGRPRKK